MDKETQPWWLKSYARSEWHDGWGEVPLPGSLSPAPRGTAQDLAVTPKPGGTQAAIPG